MTARCPHCQGEVGHAISSPQVLAALGSLSTSTEAQEARIIEALRTGSKTTDQLRAIGCYQVSARIWKLREDGYTITTALFNGYAADGMKHARMARYTLVSEPLPLDTKEGAVCE